MPEIIHDFLFFRCKSFHIFSIYDTNKLNVLVFQLIIVVNKTKQNSLLTTVCSLIRKKRKIGNRCLHSIADYIGLITNVLFFFFYHYF